MTLNKIFGNLTIRDKNQKKNKNNKQNNNKKLHQLIHNLNDLV